MVLTRHLFWLALVPALAFGQRDTTRDALARMEALMTVRASNGDVLAKKDTLPIIIVSTEARYEETKAWYPTQAVGAVVRIFGAANVRVCEACMAPRLYVEQGRVEQNTLALTSTEIIRLDEAARGSSLAAKTALWLDETARGVSLRIISLADSRVVAAENFDDSTTDSASLQRNATLLREQERRVRGDALAHAFIDVGVLPMQHVSLDWSEQWGETNANLSGISISAFDPVLGIGASYFRIIPEVLNLTVGAKVLVSLPTALAKAVSPDINTLIDPLFSAALVLRLPIAKSNFGVVFTLSTNGRVALGISLLNVSLLPVLP